MRRLAQITTRALTTWSLITISLYSTLQNNHQTAWCRPNEAPAERGTGASDGDQASNRSVTRAQAFTPASKPAECAVFADYGKNYLTPIDLIVTSSETNVVCIKARFAISIRVEEAPLIGPHESHEAQARHQAHSDRPILGYVPLEHVLKVEESCPESFAKQSSGQDGQETKDEKKRAPDSSHCNESKSNQTQPASGGVGGTNATKSEITDNKRLAGQDDGDDDELELIVTFECGKLSFTFKRDKSRIFVSAIRGMVKLDKRVVREFIAIRPMFLTSDLDHHFKYDDEIEVPSEVQSGAHILTAMFYFTEIEAFRETPSRDFIKPPDDKSLPVQDEQQHTNGEEEKLTKKQA